MMWVSEKKRIAKLKRQPKKNRKLVIDWHDQAKLGWIKVAVVGKWLGSPTSINSGINLLTDAGFRNHPQYQWVDLREHLQEATRFHRKKPWFPVDVYPKPMHWI